MKCKILNASLIITSLLGYMEWGGGNHMFLFTAEAEVLTKLFTDPISALHPFTLLPLLGQVLLIITLFQNTPSKVLTYISMAALGLLLGFLFIIGVMSLNYKVILSTLPFILSVIICVRYYRGLNKNK